MAKKKEASPETQAEALAITKKIQKAGQTKEQSRLIAQGIQKGIADYKFSSKKKQRDAEKASKKLKREKLLSSAEMPLNESNSPKRNSSKLAWGLLVASWAFFIAFYLSTMV